MKIISRKEAKLKGLTRYYTGKPCKHGHVSERHTSKGTCCECQSIRMSTEHAIKVEKEYRERVKDKVKLRSKEWYENNKERRKEYNENNKRRRKELRRSSSYKKKAKEYRERNKDRISEQRLKNRDNRNKLERKRYKNDPKVKCAVKCRQMLTRVLNKIKINKTESTYSVLGYTAAELKEHLESLFLDGMTWENRGEWHVDHIVPVSWWLENGITDPSQINALINLQPLWAEDNLKKSNKLI